MLKKNNFNLKISGTNHDTNRLLKTGKYSKISKSVIVYRLQSSCNLQTMS